MNQANFLEALGWAIINSLWQLALLWILYQVIVSAGRLNSRIKGSIAAAMLITGFLWFLYTFLNTWMISPTESQGENSYLSSGSYEINFWLEQALPAASVLYLAILLFPILRFIKNFRYVQVIRTYGLSKINVDWRIFVKRIALNIGLKRKVNIWVSELVSSPVTIGFLKPVILIPLAAINNLTTQQLEAVLLHELAHIKRNDYLINIIINVIKTIMYFNPFVTGFVKIIEREREKSCDDMVLQFQYDSHAYASALVLLEKSGWQQPLQLRATGKKSDLLHRVETILGVPRKKSISLHHIGGVFTGLICIIALNAIFLLSKPLQGQKNPTISRLASSLNIFTGNANTAETTSPDKHTELPATITNYPLHEESIAEEIPEQAILPKYSDSYPSYLSASYEAAAIQPLKNYQEEQVKLAMESSKKVLENIQWKLIEQSIADAFSQKEKEEIKNVYENEVNKINWKEWENNLRSAYSEIDWDAVNSKLDKAVTEVRIDSIQKVYNLALTKLDKVKSELRSHEMKGIPDSDITLSEIEKARSQTLKAINVMRAIRNKKIVHL